MLGSDWLLILPVNPQTVECPVSPGHSAGHVAHLDRRDAARGPGLRVHDHIGGGEDRADRGLHHALVAARLRDGDVLDDQVPVPHTSPELLQVSSPLVPDVV